VHRTGSDSSPNPYDINTPIYSINKASNIAVPGDVIKLRGTGSGQPYQYMWQQYFTASGTSTNRITIQSYDGEWALLDGSLRSDITPVLGVSGPTQSGRLLANRITRPRRGAPEGSKTQSRVSSG
jgi:hypothetical protein